VTEPGGARAHFVPQGTAPSKPMRYGRGSAERVVDEALGATQVDFHINTIFAGSAPGPFHLHHRVENVYYVLHGRVLIRTAGEEVEIGPGDAVFFPRGVAHSATNVGTEDARIIEIYAPVGPDFVELEAER
jgi:mannose-6-phosphate isomerase-like protein (cupin superfamily)